MFAVKPDDLSSIPRTHKMEKGNRFPKVVLCPSHAHYDMCVDMQICTHVHTQNNFFKKYLKYFYFYLKLQENSEVSSQ